VAADWRRRRLLVVFAFVIAACGAVDPLVLRSPEVDPSSSIALAALPQSVFVAPFRDLRPVRDRVGTAASVMSISRGPLVLEREPVAVVRDAVQSGIRARGHRIVEDAAHATVVLGGEIKELWVDTYFQPIGAERVARVEVRLSAQRPGGEVVAGTRTLRAEAKVYAGNQIAVRPAVDALEAALRELAKRAATDHALDVAIQSAAESQ
jgi:hypothetical protein